MAMKWNNWPQEPPTSEEQLRARIEERWCITPSGSPAWTASEAELMMVPNGSTDLVHGHGQPIDAVLRASATGRLDQEFRGWMLEAAPDCQRNNEDDWTTADRARHGVVSLYQDMLEACDAANVTLLPLADGHSWNANRVGLATPPATDRYRRLSRELLPGVEFSASSCGFQTHTAHALPFGDAYMRALAACTQCAPLLLAASANSWCEWAGAHSTRYMLFTALPSTTGPWWTADEMVSELFALFQVGQIQGPWDIHPWEKITHVSSETRVSDTPGSVLEAMALHAVSHAMKVYFFNEARSGRDLYRMHPQLLNYALAAAAKNGLSDLDVTLPNLFGRGRASLRQLYAEFKARIGPVMDSLGYGYEREFFFHWMVDQQNNGAIRFERWWKAAPDHPVRRKRHVLDSAHQYLRDSMNAAQRCLTSPSKECAAR